MPKKQPSAPAAIRRNKFKRTHYFDRDLWDRLQAFARSQDPVVTDTAVIAAALRDYLDAREDGGRPRIHPTAKES